MHTDYDTMWAELDDMKKYGPSSRHTRRLIRQAARRLLFSTVVDVGCGDGTLLLEMRKWFPGLRKLYGLDLSEEAVRRAGQVSGAEVFQCDISRHAPAIRADLAICSEVLEHIDDDVAALRHIARIAPQAIFTVPCGPITEDQKRAGHLRRYTAPQLAEKCGVAGLQPTAWTHWGFPFFDLYKRAVANRAWGYQTGRYSWSKKLACHGLYYLFMLNWPGHGERLIMTAKSS